MNGRIVAALALALLVAAWVWAEGGIRLSTGGLLLPASWTAK